MNRRIDRFLLGLLWLLSTTLGANFWFSTKFGFNIFFASHWEYLGQLQASGSDIDPIFYISMVLIVFLMMFGLYLIVRPRFRKINLQQTNISPTIQPVEQNLPKQLDSVIKPVQQPAAPTPGLMVRPPRLSIPVANNYIPPKQSNFTQDIPNSPIPASRAFETNVPSLAQPDNTSLEIEEIFKNTGYISKKPPRIGNFRPDLFAIGSDETLWVGGVYTNPEKMKIAVEKLHSIFTETLEDIEIKIKSFIINPTDNMTNENVDSIKFDSVETLQNYMNEHKNRELTSSETEDFEAYSEYIDTVSDYFNKS